MQKFTNFLSCKLKFNHCVSNQNKREEETWRTRRGAEEDLRCWASVRRLWPRRGGRRRWILEREIGERVWVSFCCSLLFTLLQIVKERWTMQRERDWEWWLAWRREKVKWRKWPLSIMFAAMALDSKRPKLPMSPNRRPDNLSPRPSPAQSNINNTQLFTTPSRNCYLNNKENNNEKSTPTAHFLLIPPPLSSRCGPDFRKPCNNLFF